MSIEELKIVDLFDEIEKRIRRIIREEITAVIVQGKPITSEWEALKSLPHKEARKTGFTRLLTVPDVAEMFGISVPRVYELVRTRKTNNFPVIVLGERQYRFSREDLLEWMQRENQ